MNKKEEEKIVDNKTAIVKKDLSQSERFTQLVEKEFTGGKTDIALTDFQKRLAKNYFIATDYMLKTTEEKRLKKPEQYREDLPYVWQNVNMELLVRNVVSSARIGLDPAQSNHINLIPYKNNALKKYDIGFINGYRGKELTAKKYGLEIPEDIIIELVYSKDVFKIIKKDNNNKIESYIFEVKDSFDRGTIVGGFYYYLFANPIKNKVVSMNLSDIEKRKPKYASVEFWGGEKDKYTNGKKDGKEKIEGWFPEMCWKTIARAAYGGLTIDSQKIDDDYMTLSLNEQSFKTATVQENVKTEIENTPITNITMDISHEEVADSGISEEEKKAIEAEELARAEKETPKAKKEVKKAGEQEPKMGF